MRWLILIFLPSAAAYSLLTITASPTTGQQTQSTSSATNSGYSASSRDAFSSPIYFGIVSPAASTVLTTTVSRTIGPLSK
ncbi:hypothetical protein P5673_011224 [Acropora cervicornis]|uniref:Uncharacterized protein n=1 Tax=Acropora cervicornis TaxID=6130 RepID=A0AAD9QQ42_ACRCE|nr:hypothetical protein P5673_011224 [Acropora cervicornis]